MASEQAEVTEVTEESPPVAAEGSLAQLVELVAAGSVAALRASFAIELAKAGNCLSPRQELPDRAFWTAAQLTELLGELTAKFGAADAERRFGLVFVGVCCNWLTAEHPDPDGHHLDLVAKFATSYLAAAPTQPSAAAAWNLSCPSSTRRS